MCTVGACTFFVRFICLGRLQVLSPLTQQAGQRVASAYPQYQHMANVANATVDTNRLVNGSSNPYRSKPKKR